MKKDKNTRTNRNICDSRVDGDEIFDPDENLFNDQESQSISSCHPMKYKNQKSAKKCEKDSFDEI